MSNKKKSDGQRLDTLRMGVIKSLKTCKAREAALTKAGVQRGNFHFKSDRPTSMLIWEPSEDGGRKYVHVGTDPEKQAIKQAEIERWGQRDRLQKAITSLESELKDVDYQIKCLLHIIESVHEHSCMIIDKHVDCDVK